jgi:hypothetical protein
MDSLLPHYWAAALCASGIPMTSWGSPAPPPRELAAAYADRTTVTGSSTSTGTWDDMGRGRLGRTSSDREGHCHDSTLAHARRAAHGLDAVARRGSAAFF